MLQPLQLQDVSARFANEIAELRDFLTKAGNPPLGTAETLHGVAARLRDDRAYRRDLTSYIWVVVHQTNQNVSYSELLGMLAIAAAGPHFAAAADEGDAHILLRFLMEARGSFDTGAEPRKASPVPWPATPLPLRPIGPLATIGEEDEESSDDRRPVLFIAAACLLVALLAGVWWHYKSIADRETAAALASRSAAGNSSSSGAENTAPVASPTRETATATAPPTSVARRSAHSLPSGPFVPASDASSPTKLPAHATIEARSTANPIQPATPLNRHSAASPTPIRPKAATADDDIAEDTPPPFRLLRRQPAATSAVASSGKSNPAAETHPAEAPSGSGDSRVGTANVSRGGIVRPTSLGAMAANVMYSPAPSYPTDASAAHVQGEVKVEAEVDRDGNVTSARVISGPPLLREAAADAVEHWRYRPYLYGGKPISMSALVVMDFKLP